MSETTMRDWYTPIEMRTLKRWLVATVVVNVLLLTLDVLRMNQPNLFYGCAGCILLIVLHQLLPQADQRWRKDISLLLSGGIMALGALRLVSIEITLFNLWMQAWLIVPGATSLWWLSSRPVSAWASRKLSTQAVEYGLQRNHGLDEKHHANREK